MNNLVHIAMSLNNAYTKPVEVSISSILLNAEAETCYYIYILHHELSYKNQAILEKTFYNSHSRGKITFLKIDLDIYKSIPKVGRFPAEANFRLLLPTLLPNIGKIIYLDADTITLSDLNDLYQIDLTNKALASIVEGEVTLKTNGEFLDKNASRTYYFFTQILKCKAKDYNYYINSGVMILNLDYWRKHNWQERSLKFLYRHHAQILYPDQDAINYLIFSDGVDKLVKLDFSWGFLAFYFLKTPSCKGGLENAYANANNKFYFEAFTAKSFDNYQDYTIKILHYANSAPWSENGLNNPYIYYFDKYANIVGFKNYKFKVLSFKNFIDKTKSYLSRFK